MSRVQLRNDGLRRGPPDAGWLVGGLAVAERIRPWASQLAVGATFAMGMVSGYVRYWRTVREFGAMSNDALRDIGIKRDDIRCIARAAQQAPAAGRVAHRRSISMPQSDRRTTRF
jgi:uncharacterized protein YjiS (DUF1127 family)